VSRASLVAFAPLSPGRDLPLLARQAVGGVDLAGWLAENRDEVRRELLGAGGILFRGFGVDSEARLQALLEALAGELVQYTYRSTPRTALSGRIYTSTEYPPDQEIPLHNEMSYSRSWPLLIGFACLKAAPSGGETPIASSRGVYARLDPALRERFASRGVMYVRNYGGGFDLPWQEVFQTADQQAVEAFCAEAGIEVEWREGDRLRTRQVCQAVARHPATGEPVWFNQAHLFHPSSLDPEVHASLLEEFGEEDLPRKAFYGDGSPLEEEALAAVREAMEREKVVFPWEEGDFLLLDNMLAAHGRMPFAGPRKIVVGMAEPAGSGGPARP
jgi:alpha-ketoglutarate-dependent taurine dioxygenase